MTNDPNKKKPAIKTPEEKFAEEQAYSEQGFHLEDPEKDIPEIPEEKGIASTDEEGNGEKQNKE